MKTPREKYANDAVYRQLVDCMVAHIEAANYTPSEMREAAVLACIIYEQHHIKLPFIEPKVNKALETIEGFLGGNLQGCKGEK